MGFEVVLFMALGLIAIACAIGMLVSKNAVHSALFLIGNFGAVAVLFLMLDAPFISMVQIAVYTGAIMVLFLFVIMLLGAERTGDTDRQFRWLAGAATTLAVSFLIAFGAPVLLAGLELPGSTGETPLVRVIHAAQIGDPADEDVSGSVADITAQPVTLTISGETLDDALVLGDLQFSDISDFIELEPGTYTVSLATADGTPITETDLTLTPDDVFSVIAYGQADVSDPQAEIGLPFGVLALPQSRTPTDANQARVQALNLYQPETLNLVDVGPDRELDVSDDGTITDVLHVEEVPYATTTGAFNLRDGAHQLAFFPANPAADSEPLQRLFDYSADDGVTQLIVLVPDYDSPLAREVYRPRVLDSTGERLRLPTLEAFGSPGDIGIDLFTTYLLPVNLVGFLLLVALIGVIMLTRPTGPDFSKRRATRNRRRKVSRPLVSVISQQTGRDVVTDTPRLNQPDTPPDTPDAPESSE
jgi:NADH-quinone oxidoreductase subunit J